jgi:DTW domain-containing protein YfiP
VADVVPDTFAFEWSRTQVDAQLTALLEDPAWQPVIAFPAEFAPPERVITRLAPDAQRRPLFILLDGTWAEARKAFRKSPWLDRFPVLALNPQQASRYRLRQASHEHHLCTSEVAALCLDMAGDGGAAQALAARLEVFNERSLRSRFGQRVQDAAR